MPCRWTGWNNVGSAAYVSAMPYGLFCLVFCAFALPAADRTPVPKPATTSSVGFALVSLFLQRSAVAITDLHVHATFLFWVPFWDSSYPITARAVTFGFRFLPTFSLLQRLPRYIPFMLPAGLSFVPGGRVAPTQPQLPHTLVDVQNPLPATTPVIWFAVLLLLACH